MVSIYLTPHIYILVHRDTELTTRSALPVTPFRDVNGYNVASTTAGVGSGSDDTFHDPAASEGSMAAVDGPLRLRGAGVGSIVGGCCLAVFAIALTYAWASIAVVAIGVLLWLVNRSDGLPTTRVKLVGVGVGVGVAAIGTIGLVESFLDAGMGIGPFFLAVLAIVVGALDVLAGTVFARLKRR